MTYKTMNEINFLASAGLGYQRIAEQLGISANTVKSHVQRHPPQFDKIICENCGQPVPLTCKHCGKGFVSYGNVNRKYCSRVCYGNARKRRT